MTVQSSVTPLLYAVEGRELIPLPVPEGVHDVHALFDGLPLGVYEALRTYQQRRFLGLDEHLDRMQSSGKSRRLEISFRPDDLRVALQAAVDSAPFPDSRVRIDLLAKAAPQLGTTSRLLLALVPLIPMDPELLEKGVGVSLERDLSRREPEVKAAAWVLERRPLPMGTAEAFEHLLVDAEGRLLEGTSSNLFCVRNQVLYTAPSGVLKGITRRMVLDLATEQNLSTRLTAIREDEIESLDEAFITSSSRQIVPVVSIEGKTLGDGSPGPLTRRLMAGYEDLVQRRARPAASAPGGEGQQ